MATAISTFEGFIEILDSDPKRVEDLRARLLTRDLLAMPAVLAAFIETTNRRFDDIDRRLDVVERRLDAVDRRLDAVDRRLDVVDRRLDAVDRRLDVVERRLDAVDRRLDAVERRLQLLEDRTGRLIGAHARNEAIREVVLLPRNMGFGGTGRLWSREDIDQLIDSSDTADIPPDDLKSFNKADGIVEADDDEGRTCYIAVEISYTVNGRDTSRAIRNAAYMTRLTGQPAYPAVMGVRIDERVRDIVESGEVYWYRLEPSILEVE